MKTKFLSALTLLLTLTLILASCAVTETSLWDSATYTEDTTVGNGAKTLSVDIEAEDKKITITVKTDKYTLGEALFEHCIINDASFFDTANGIKADWDADNAYWSFYKGSEYMMHGVGDEIVSGGEAYRLVYTK